MPTKTYRITPQTPTLWILEEEGSRHRARSYSSLVRAHTAAANIADGHNPQEVHVRRDLVSGSWMWTITY